MRSREQWVAFFEGCTTPQELYQRALKWMYPREKMQEPRYQVGVNRRDGPMQFLADQIVKRMERAGYPTRIVTGYRGPEKQNEVWANGRSKAKAWESAHQYFEAADIVHKSLYWNASPDYWEKLAIVVRNVAAEYGVPLEHGHHWKFVDSAHVEIKSWRDVRKAQLESEGQNYRPNELELLARFTKLLPAEVA